MKRKESTADATPHKRFRRVGRRGVENLDTSTDMSESSSSSAHSDRGAATHDDRRQRQVAHHSRTRSRGDEESESELVYEELSRGFNSIIDTPAQEILSSNVSINSDNEEISSSSSFPYYPSVVDDEIIRQPQDDEENQVLNSNLASGFDHRENLSYGMEHNEERPIDETIPGDSEEGTTLHSDKYMDDSHDSANLVMGQKNEQVSDSSPRAESIADNHDADFNEKTNETSIELSSHTEPGNNHSTTAPQPAELVIDISEDLDELNNDSNKQVDPQEEGSGRAHEEISTIVIESMSDEERSAPGLIIDDEPCEAESLDETNQKQTEKSPHDIRDSGIDSTEEGTQVTACQVDEKYPEEEEVHSTIPQQSPSTNNHMLENVGHYEETSPMRGDRPTLGETEEIDTETLLSVACSIPQQINHSDPMEESDPDANAPRVTNSQREESFRVLLDSSLLGLSNRLLAIKERIVDESIELGKDDQVFLPLILASKDISSVKKLKLVGLTLDCTLVEALGNLESLDFDGCEIVSMESLEGLPLSHFGIKNKVPTRKTLDLIRCLSGSLESLSLSDSSMGYIDTTIIKNLTNLDLSGSKINNEKAEAIVKSLDHLIEINLSSTGVNGHLMLKSKSLRSLDVSRNRIGTDGLWSIVLMMKRGELVLHRLIVSGNEIDSHGMVQLSACENIRHLDVSFNPIGSEGLMTLAKGSLAHTLVSLCVAGCGFKNMRASGILFPCLTELDISQNIVESGPLTGILSGAAIRILKAEGCPISNGLRSPKTCLIEDLSVNIYAMRPAMPGGREYPALRKLHLVGRELCVEEVAEVCGAYPLEELSMRFDRIEESDTELSLLLDKMMESKREYLFGVSLYCGDESEYQLYKHGMTTIQVRL